MKFGKPAILISKKGDIGIINLNGDIMEIDISSIPEVNIGDYLLIKDGKAICIYEYESIKNSYARHISSDEADSENENKYYI